MSKQIQLPNDYFPASLVILKSGNKLGYKMSILGFDGNLMYEGVSSFEELEDSDEKWLSDIGTFLLENESKEFWKSIDKGLGIK